MFRLFGEQVLWHFIQAFTQPLLLQALPQFVFTVPTHVLRYRHCHPPSVVAGLVLFKLIGSKCFICAENVYQWMIGLCAESTEASPPPHVYCLVRHEAKLFCGLSPLWFILIIFYPSPNNHNSPSKNHCMLLVQKYFLKVLKINIQSFQ